MSPEPELRISVLGPLRLAVGGTVVEVPGPKRRAVLALLALAAPRPVTAASLVDDVWSDAAPASGRAALQSHVSRLRRHLGPHAGRLRSSGSGYCLDLRPGELDLERVTAAVRAARADREHDPARARDLLAAARAEWTGPPLAGLDHVDRLVGRARSLAELALEVTDLLVDCSLEVGDTATAVEAAGDGLAADPLREPGAIRVVRALAASGRPAEALRAAHRFRRRLAEETGLDASPALAELEAQVAAGEVVVPTRSLEPASPPAREAPARTRHVAAGALHGRDTELSGLLRLIERGQLVTVVGPAGVGKTRLAVEVARRAGGAADPEAEVTELRLAEVTDADAVPGALAAALGLESGQGDPVERSALRLAAGPHLLVVDNAEHLLEAVRDLVATLLDRCPELAVLVTSRERLALPGEQTCRVAPLAMPAPGDEPTDAPSVGLFLERARAVRPDFDPGPAELDAVARIVQALDGMPLAIELAAGRVSSLTLPDLEVRLDRALDLLGSGGAKTDRHGTLRAAIEWSYALLPDHEQAMFRNLAVFAGGFDLATAEAVASQLALPGDPAAAVAHLVDASMVVAELDGTGRYRMLDTLRSFGIDRLGASGELDVATSRLFAWAVELARWVDRAYDTDDEARADASLVVELANLRAAWHASRAAGDLDTAASLVANLFNVGIWRDLDEVLRWALELAEDPALVGHPAEAAVLGVASEAAWKTAGNLDLAEQLAERGLAIASPDDRPGRLSCTFALSDVWLFRERFEEAGSLARSAREGTRLEVEGILTGVLAATYRGDLEHARDLLDRARRASCGPTMTAYRHYAEGELANAAGDHVGAQESYRDAIAVGSGSGATFVVGVASVGLVTAQVAGGDIESALTGYRSLIDRWERIGAWTQQWTTLRNLADLLEQLGEREESHRLRACADAAPESAGLAGVRPAAGSSRGEALELARSAIDRALAGVSVPGSAG